MKTHWSLEFSCGIGNIECINVTRNSGFTLKYKHGRKKHRFVYVKRGKMKYVFFEDSEFEVLEGTLMWIPEGRAYTAAYLDDDTEAVIILFDLLYGELPEVLLEPLHLNIPNAEELVRSILDCPSEVGLGWERAVYYTYRTYELLWRVVSNIAMVPKGAERIAPALREINRHFEEQRSVSYYSDMCYMSETGFRRLFGKYVGCSPVEYRNRIRLGEARKMIRSGEYTVEEAARAVGFSNISFFCRAYRQQYGSTPLGKS